MFWESCVLLKQVLPMNYAMVTDFEPWSVSTTKWLREIAHKNIPILGICYGHQLLAQAWDGTVDYHYPTSRW